MKKRMISVLGWSSALFIFLGASRFFNISAHDINIERVGLAILLFTIAALANFIANRLGWNTLEEINSVAQIFQRIKASSTNRIPPIFQDGLPTKKRTFRLIHLPVRLRLFLYTTSFICLLFLIALEMINGIQGISKSGHALLNFAIYVFVSLAAIPLVIGISLSILFFFRSILLFMRNK